MGSINSAFEGLGRKIPVVGPFLTNVWHEFVTLGGIDPLGLEPVKSRGKSVNDFGFGGGEPYFAVPFGLGPNNRVAGRVVWASDVRRKAIETTSGKGGSGATTETTSYNYYVDLAVAFAEAPAVTGVTDFAGTITEPASIGATTLTVGGLGTTETYPAGTVLKFTVSGQSVELDADATMVAGAAVVTLTEPLVTAESDNAAFTVATTQIAGVTTILADTRFLWGQDPEKDVTSDLLSATASTAGKKKVKTFLTVASAAAGPNLKKFQQGSDVTMSGWTGGSTGNNGTFRVVKRWLDKTTGISYLKLQDMADPATVVTAADGDTVTILQALEEFKANDSADVAIYLGTPDQDADPTMEAALGAANTPTFRGLAYFVVSNLKVTKYGRIPQFTVVYRAHETITVKAAVALLADRADQPDGTFVTDDLSTDALLGYTIDAPSAVSDQIAPLLLAYDIQARESAGALTFFHRADAQHIAVDADLLSATPSGGSGQQDLDVARSAAVDLPSEVLVTYRDPTRDLQSRGERQTRTSATNRVVQNVQIPLALTSEDARKIAKRLLWLPWQMRQGPIKARLPMSLGLTVQQGDVLDVTTMGDAWALLVQGVDEDLRAGAVEIDAVNDDTGVIDMPVVTEADGDPLDPDQFPELLLFTFDIPATDEATLQLPGFYAGVLLHDPTVTWTGCILYESLDEGATWQVADTIASEATGGFATTVIGAGLAGAWDTASTVNVEVFNGELSSVTADDVLNGANRAMLGDEMLAFTDATLVSETGGAKTYTLSGFLRGLRDTEAEAASATETHAVGEPFAMLATTKFIPVTLDSFGKERSYKAVPIGGVEADYDDTDELVLTLATLRPFSPQILSATVADNETVTYENITLRWLRRTRAFVDPFGDVADAPLVEELAEYEVEVYDTYADPDNPVRTETVAGTGAAYEEFVYTKAMQIADSINTGIDPLGDVVLQFRVYQKSTSVGRGLAASTYVGYLLVS